VVPSPVPTGATIVEEPSGVDTCAGGGGGGGGGGGWGDADEAGVEAAGGGGDGGTAGGVTKAVPPGVGSVEVTSAPREFR
jgi:hypothetical protein